MRKSRFIIYVLILLVSVNNTWAKDKKEDKKDKVLQGVKLRNLGPALMSGRISDIAIHPNNENTWYVGVGSGGVWKTINAGTTWTPIFDKEKVFSIGSVTIDPSNPNRIWVGTGENVGGRHMSFGDGIYLSVDGGDNWKNMGLKDSEHISTVVIHPNDSNTLWVAAQGPLWSKGGDRGLYKTKKEGKTWEKALLDDDAGRYAFKEFRFSYKPIKYGKTTVMAKAVNRLGQEQPFAKDIKWNHGGYKYNGIDTVTFEVV